MTYLEKWIKEHKGTMSDFRHAQEDYDGFCPPDIGMNECTGMSCSKCWERDVKESEEE